MNSKILMLLGCSSSLATTILAPHSVQALMPNNIPGANVSVPSVNVTRTSSQSDFSQESGMSESMVKQYAQTKFGCTCASCMNLARQMLQQGGSAPTSPVGF
ncbi:MAG: hypothetical protein V7K32_01490 [Nostoc sp.]|uniref:hypothetical protein n=1 Tax=Nostoc sp. TaxID=1180 RepID=UPI002FFC5FA0